LLLMNFLLCLGFYMLPATLPAYVKQLGASNLEVAWVIGAFSVTSMLARVVSGSVVDALGESKLILAGILTIAISTTTFIWLPARAIILLRCVQGIGWGLATAAIATAVYRVVPAARRGEGAGYYALTVILAMSLTPLVAILLMQAWGFWVLLLVSSVLTLASIGLLRRALAGVRRPPLARHARRPISLRAIFEPGAVLPAVLCFINTIPLCGVMAYLLLFGQQRHIDNIWLFFIGYTLMILLTRPFMGRLFDRRGPGPIIVPGCLAMLLGLLCLSLTEGSAMLVLSSLLYGLGYGMVHPSLQTMAVNRCPFERKAAANGLFLSAIDLGYIVGALGLGWIAGWQGYALMYRYATLALLLFLAVYAFDRRRSGRQKT
jgi:MFS family permease